MPPLSFVSRRPFDSRETDGPRLSPVLRGAESANHRRKNFFVDPLPSPTSTPVVSQNSRHVRNLDAPASCTTTSVRNNTRAREKLRRGGTDRSTGISLSGGTAGPRRVFFLIKWRIAARYRLQMTGDDGRGTGAEDFLAQRFAERRVDFREGVLR